MHDVEVMHLGFRRWAVTAEGRVDRGMDPLLEGPGTGLLGFPDVDVPQATARLADRCSRLPGIGSGPSLSMMPR